MTRIAMSRLIRNACDHAIGEPLAKPVADPFDLIFAERRTKFSERGSRLREELERIPLIVKH